MKAELHKAATDAQRAMHLFCEAMERPVPPSDALISELLDEVLKLDTLGVKEIAQLVLTVAAVAHSRGLIDDASYTNLVLQLTSVES